ncbi:serine/threonine protein kinase [Corallococcus sp. H22C18031201]|nr:serine/threonine protein kinase [Corallococcus sp. H22C18031201]
MASTERDRFGRYELVSRIGRGGMAETWQARLMGAAGVTKSVLIKKVLQEYASDDAFTSMFISEARISATLSHGNIAQVFDFGEVDGEYFLAMEFVDGQPLNRILKRAFHSGLTAIPAPIATFIAMEMCRGLHYAHTRTAENGAPLGIVHRDISPDNVIVSFEGQVKIVDFGIAKARSLSSANTAPGVVKGKYLFFSPEQARGEDVDGRTDVWATGVVLYEMLCGKLPLAGPEYLVMPRLMEGQFPRPRQLRPDLPVALERILMRALSVDWEQRYPSCHEFADALAGFLYSAAPRFSAMHLAHLLRMLFREDLSALGRDTKVPPSFEEELSLWRASAPPKPLPLEPPSARPTTAREEARALGALPLPDTASLSAAPHSIEPAQWRWIWLGTGLSLVFLLGMAGVFSGARESAAPPAETRPEEPRPIAPAPAPDPRALLLAGNVAPVAAAGPTATPVNVTARSAPPPKVEEPDTLTWPANSIRLDAQRHVLLVSAAKAAVMVLNADTHYLLSEAASDSSRATESSPLIYFLKGPRVSAEDAVGELSPLPTEIHGASMLYVFTLAPEFDRPPKKEPSWSMSLTPPKLAKDRNVNVLNTETHRKAQLRVQPNWMNVTHHGALSLEGLSVSGTFRLKFESEGSGAFTEGRGKGATQVVACLEAPPRAEESLARPEPKPHTLLLHEGIAGDITGVRALRCGVIDDDPADNKGTLLLHVEKVTPGADKASVNRGRGEGPVPTEIQQLINEGRDLVRAKEYSLANSVAKDCAQKAPDNAECQLLLGLTHCQLKNLEEGTRHYRRFLNLAPANHPKRGWVKAQLSWAQMMMGRGY